MRNQPIDLGTLTIPNGGTESDALDLQRTPVNALVIFVPPTLSGTVTVQVSPDEGTTWTTLTTTGGGANVTVGAGKAVPIEWVGYDQLRLSSTSAEAADRDFVVVGIEEF